MIIINKSGYLKFKNHKFRCALGKSGVGEKKIEGDNLTPKGTYKIIKIYYREDRIRKISDAFELCYEVDKTIKNRNECDMLKINKSNELREKIIKVNEYKKEEF